MKEQTKIGICIIIITGLIIISLIMMFAWIYTPTNFTIQFQMDNNTLEAVKNINWSVMK
jgi:hypothetical protein